MKFKRAAPALVELFQGLLGQTRGNARTMFGCPCGFLNGNMFMGLFGDQLFLRLSESERVQLLGEQGAEAFDPMGGRPMREYVVVPAEWLEGEADVQLRAWVAKAAAYAATLPAKRPRKAAGRSSAKRSAKH